ncbi:hypothetical protein RRG08_051562, partial [Elysia crispata]
SSSKKANNLNQPNTRSKLNSSSEKANNLNQPNTRSKLNGESGVRSLGGKKSRWPLGELVITLKTMRVYKRKGPNEAFSPGRQCLKSVRLVLDQGQKIKPQLGESLASIIRHWVKIWLALLHKRNSYFGIDNKQFGLFKRSHKRILNDEQEQMVADYLIQPTEFYYGLTKIEFRTLTFEFAKINNIPTPTSFGRKPDGQAKTWVYQFFLTSIQNSL